MNRIIMAGTHSGAGKTTITVGLLAALKRKGIKVQPFKVGPDYIDTSYHSIAAGVSSYNLDGWMMPAENLLQLFAHGMKGMDFGLIEGVMGLYDGMGSTATGSTADIAKLLAAPVILVVDARGMAASAAAQVRGYKYFDRRLRLKGVILNNVGSARHFELIKSAIQKMTGVQVLGCLPADDAIKLPSRHLGLLPAGEVHKREEVVEKLALLIEKHIDVNQIIELGRKTKPVAPVQEEFFSNPLEQVKIAVARDESFSFYYRSTLELLKSLGAVIENFSPLIHDRLPENARGLYLGGGFPEVFAEDLALNSSLRKDIRDKLGEGLPCYAECGGLMYLTDSIVTREGKEFPMVGFFDGKTVMTGRLQRFGYVDINFTRDNLLGKKGQTVRGHEFHYSDIEGMSSPATYLVKSASRETRWNCGYLKKNVLSAYAHIDFWGYPDLARHFLETCSL